MKVVIDGQAKASESIVGENLEEILSELQTNHINGNVVGNVTVNGLEYTEEVPHAALEVSRTTIDTLELSTLTAEEIAWHFITNGEAIINSMLESLPQIVEMFRLGDEAEANEHWLKFLESLHILLNMLGDVGKIIDLNHVLKSESGESVETHLERLTVVISELLRIQEENDWIYLADIMEYELTDELGGLRKLISNHTQRLN